MPSELNKKICDAMVKCTQAGDEEARAMMTAAVLLEAPDDDYYVSAISACITGIFQGRGKALHEI